MFAFQDTRGGTDVAFTDRHGGVSGGPFGSLNLARSGTDESAHVRRNIELVTRAFSGWAPAVDPPRVVGMHQVHGGDVHVVGDEHLDSPRNEPVIVADALVTALPGVVLMVRVADCVPLLLADPDAGVVAAVHAGRPGLVAGIVPAALASMRALGAQRPVAWMGPHVCGSCYEVPAEMRADVTSVVPESYAETSWGTPSVDIGAGVRAQLDRAGVPVTETRRCTIEDDDLFSYRRQGAASGRLAGLVWIRP